jgi:hypothetical protein
MKVNLCPVRKGSKRWIIEAENSIVTSDEMTSAQVRSFLRNLDYQVFMKVPRIVKRVVKR